MLRGHWRGRTLGSGTDVFKLHAERRAGNLSDEDWNSLESGFARSAGTCMVMGTASTMMSIAEVLGRSEEHTSELQSLMRISYAVFCLKKKKTIHSEHITLSYL